MKSKLIIIFFSICFSLSVSHAQIVINELMPAPNTDEPEWLEIYNFTDSTVELTGLSIINKNSTKSIGQISFPARSYTVLTGDSSKFSSKRKLPSGAFLLEVDLPTLHNDFDPIVLKDETGKFLDSLYYDMKWGKKGISLERKDYLKPAVSQENLAPSVSPDSATAGAENSTALRDYEISAKIIFTKNSAEVMAVNKGRFRPDTVLIKIYIDKNRDGNLTDDEKFRDIEYYSGNRDTVSLVFSLSQFQTFAGKPGWFSSYLTVEDKARHNQSSHSAEFFCSYPRNSVVINEFLFDESDSCGEYVELFNTTSDSIPLRDWFISNRHSVQGFDSIFIADENALILPNGYFVIFWDSLLTRKFPELKENIRAFQAVSNMNLKVSGDEILLNDAAYAVQDSLAYSDTWKSKDLAGRKDISVERISPSAESTEASNWASCGDFSGGTPLKRNSVSIQPKNKIELTAEPNPFSPADLAIKQITKISYKLPFRSARIKCSIFTPDGILLVELINNDYTSSEGSLIWNGKDSNGANAPAGPYIFLIEAVDAVSGNASDGKMMIVVGK